MRVALRAGAGGRRGDREGQDTERKRANHGDLLVSARARALRRLVCGVRLRVPAEVGEGAIARAIGLYAMMYYYVCHMYIAL